VATGPATSDAAPEALARSEAQLRALHALRIEARLQPGFEAHYVGFVRALRERLHPRGVPDVRTVLIDGRLRFLVDLGDRLGCDVFYGYYDERFEASLFAELLDPGSTVLDVGANFGYYSVVCADAVGPTGAVHAFEPDPAAFELLTANADANGLADRIHVHRFAVGDHDGTVSYHLAEEAAFSGLTSTGRSATRGVVEVRLRSLDSFAVDHGIEQIDALKIDVEGHEAEVLRGARRLLQRSADPLIMLEVTAKNLTEAARDALTGALAELFAAGYHGLLPDLQQPGGVRTITRATEAASLASANLFLVRPEEQRERRLREAVADRLASAAPVLDATPADTDTRPLRLFTGLDPDLVGAALRDKADAEGRAATLEAQIHDLTAEIERLRAERAALRAEVRRLGWSPVGLAVRAARRGARMLRGRR
jgi:FkbM family methyltransferase